MSVNLRTIAAIILIIGVLGAAVAFFQFGSERYGDFNLLLGTAAGAVALVPTLFMWGVLQGLAEMITLLAPLASTQTGAPSVMDSHEEALRKLDKHSPMGKGAV